MRRALIGLVLMLGGVAFVAFLGATAKPAAAQGRDPITATYDKPANADEPALIGDNPSAQVNNSTASTYPNPGDCRSTARTYCDTVPIIVKTPPGITIFDVWFAYVTVSWSRTQPGGCNDIGGVDNPCNDVDIYTYDDRQGDPKHATYSDTGDSASSQDPEVSKLFLPTLGTYNVVVNNFAGVNQGYHVNVSIVVYKGVTPYELLAPNVSPSGGFGRPPADTSGSSSVGAPSSNNPLPINYGPQGAALGTADIAPDASFADFPIPEEQFLAPPKGPLLLGNLIAARAKPPQPASGILIVLTMVLLPLFVIGGGVGWAFKRSRSAFNF